MCDVVLCGGVTCETQGELCDRMEIAPSGLVVLHGLEPSLETCLCTVDIEATATKNGFSARRYYEQVADWILTPNAIAQGREHSERPAGAEG